MASPRRLSLLATSVRACADTSNGRTPFSRRASWRPRASSSCPRCGRRACIGAKPSTSCRCQCRRQPPPSVVIAHRRTATSPNGRSIPTSSSAGSRWGSCLVRLAPRRSTSGVNMLGSTLARKAGARSIRCARAKSTSCCGGGGPRTLPPRCRCGRQGAPSRSGRRRCATQAHVSCVRWNGGRGRRCQLIGWAEQAACHATRLLVAVTIMGTLCGSLHLVWRRRA
mmetsp:Transcript_22633/g.52152  ORF Transcript_22633/g.52152 Transcript_22633/m.52152 type:complete len:225 (+) Transcript_22633:48-722(+)